MELLPPSDWLSPVGRNIELPLPSSALSPAKGVPSLLARMARRRSGAVSRNTKLPPPDCGDGILLTARKGERP